MFVNISLYILPVRVAQTFKNKNLIVKLTFRSCHYGHNSD